MAFNRLFPKVSVAEIAPAPPPYSPLDKWIEWIPKPLVGTLEPGGAIGTTIYVVPDEMEYFFDHVSICLYHADGARSWADIRATDSSGTAPPKEWIYGVAPVSRIVAVTVGAWNALGTIPNEYMVSESRVFPQCCRIKEFDMFRVYREDSDNCYVDYFINGWEASLRRVKNR